MKKTFLKKCMVLGIAAALTMTVEAPVYAQETDEMT